MARFRNPFDAEPIRPAPLPGEPADHTGEVDTLDPLRDAQEAPPDPPGTRLAVVFTGEGWAYTRLWMAGVLLTLLTLGLYGPWATVAKRRYLAAHTLLDGVPLVYHGQPEAILRGRALALAALAAASVLTAYVPLVAPMLAAAAIVIAPWFLQSAFTFEARNTSWRGIHFGFEGPRRDFRRSLRPLMAWPAALLAVEAVPRWFDAKPDPASEALLMLMPYAVLAFTLPGVILGLIHIRLRGTRYGSARFELAISEADFRRIAFRGFGRFAVVVGIVGTIAILAVFAVGDPDLMLIAQPVFLFLVTSAGTGRVRMQRFNLGVHRLVGTGGIRLRSSLTPEQLSRLYFVNGLWIVATCGLAAPWRRIVTRKLRARNLTIFHEAAAAAFQRLAPAAAGAGGEALAEGLNVDLSL